MPVYGKMYEVKCTACDCWAATEDEAPYQVQAVPGLFYVQPGHKIDASLLVCACGHSEWRIEAYEITQEGEVEAVVLDAVMQVMFSLERTLDGLALDMLHDKEVTGGELQDYGLDRYWSSPYDTLATYFLMKLQKKLHPKGE